MHIRTAVWIAVVCVAVWVADSVYQFVSIVRSNSGADLWSGFIWQFVAPIIGQAGLFLFLLVFAVKGGRQVRTSRRQTDEDDRDGGDGWRRR